MPPPRSVSVMVTLLNGTHFAAHIDMVASDAADDNCSCTVTAYACLSNAAPAAGAIGNTFALPGVAYMTLKKIRGAG